MASFANARDAVESSVRALFTRWMALQLTLDNYPDREKAQQAASTLFERTLVIALSQRPPNQPRSTMVDELVQLYYAAFDQLSTDIEDGSPEQIADTIIQVREAALRSDFTPATRIAHKNDTGAQVLDRCVVINNQDGSEDDGEMIDEPAELAPPQQAPAKPAIDDDGFTAVVRRGRRS